MLSLSFKSAYLRSPTGRAAMRLLVKVEFGVGGGVPVLHLPIRGHLFLKRELIDGRPMVRQSYLQLEFISNANQAMQPVGRWLLEVGPKLQRRG